MKFSRRDFLLASASSMAVFGLNACNSLNSQNNLDNTTPSPEPKKSEEKKPSEYTVTIDSLVQEQNYGNEPCAVIKFTFTNNSEEAQSFLAATRVEVYQDGRQLDMTVVSNLDNSASMSKIKTGASIEVQVAYKLISSSNVEVEVYPLIGKEKLAEQSFTL